MVFAPTVAPRRREITKMSKKIIAVLVLLFIVAGLAFFIVSMGTKPTAGRKDKLKIVATLFPQYDFAKEIAGKHAEVTLLLPPGVESHTYEPTPADIVKINAADMFIYTGKYMEQWAERIIASRSNKELEVIDVSSNIELSGMEDHDHDADDGSHDHGDGGGEDHGEHGHGHLYDPHIWTDPNNALVMVDNILAALNSADPAHAADYQKNAEALRKELRQLDADFKKVVAGGGRDGIIMGGRNAFHYFLKRYGLKAHAAHNSCSTEADPSAKKVASLIKEVKEEHIPIIFYEELSIPKVASLVNRETGVKMLPLNSCHNISREALESGATYISLMKENLRNLREGLK